jgi:hypothetical protein
LNHNAGHNKHSTAHQAAQGDKMVYTPEELGAWLRLVLTPGVGPESARRLLAAFGEPQAIFGQTETALSQVVSAKQAQALQPSPLVHHSGLSRRVSRRTQARLRNTPPAGPKGQAGKHDLRDPGSLRFFFF